MSAPCIIFFDELDALAPRRGGSDGGGSHYAERLVNQLLTEMDGLDERRAVFVIGATNRPDTIDSALMRPGRLDKSLYVRLPDAAGRLAILEKHTRSTPLDVAGSAGSGSGSVSGSGGGQITDVKSFLRAIASHSACEGFSGADMANLVREAAMSALREAQDRKRAAEIAAISAGGAAAGSQSTDLKSALHTASHPGITKYDKTSKRSAPIDVRVGFRHFEAAFSRARPSVTEKQRREYDLMAKRLGSARAMPTATPATATTDATDTTPPTTAPTNPTTASAASAAATAAPVPASSLKPAKK